MELVLLAVAIFVILLLGLVLLHMEEIKLPAMVKWGITLIVGVIWYSSTAIKLETTKTYVKSSERVIVSANPSGTSLSGSFVLGFGSISTNRYYLLREEISEGLYKDFEVRKEVYIRESNTLPHNKGLFTQASDCKEVVFKYKILLWEIQSKEGAITCDLIRQEIIVPVDYVIKQLQV